MSRRNRGYIGPSPSHTTEEGRVNNGTSGIFSMMDVRNLVSQNKYKRKEGYVYLGTHDYTTSTFSGGINIPTVANGGYLDPTNYRAHLILVSQIRQSGQYDMNIVFTFRNSGNTGGITGNYYSWGLESLQDGSDNNFVREHNSPNYMRSMNTKLKNEDDAQAVQMIYLNNIGHNSQYINLFSRTALRSFAYTGRHNSYDQSGFVGNRIDVGAFRWSGYTSSTWNAKFDIYGIRT